MLADSVADVFVGDQGRGGRPHYPVVMLLKCLMLAKWFGLSDPELEGMLRDRLSFRRFVGLGLSEDTPDEIPGATFVVFRRRLREAGHASTLFDQALAHLRAQGLVLQEGTRVDATIIEAPKGKTTGDGWGHTRDKSASFTKKHGRTYHGYKAHIATDTRGLVTDYVFDTAKVHDSKHIDQLVENEPSGGSGGAVYADSAYRDKDRKARLEGDGVFCGIVERRVRGQDELTAEQVKHNRQCAAVRAIVEHPFVDEGHGSSRCAVSRADAQRLRLRVPGHRLQLQTEFQPDQTGARGTLSAIGTRRCRRKGCFRGRAGRKKVEKPARRACPPPTAAVK